MGTMMEKARIIVAHPGRQHSVRTAEALKAAGLLDSYITTVFYGKKLTWTKFVTKILPSSLRQRAEGRGSSSLVESDLKRVLEVAGLALLFSRRFLHGSALHRWANRWVSRRFQRRVAHLAIKRSVDAVVMYDTQALACFELLSRKAPQITRILDHSHAVRDFAYSELAGLVDEAQNAQSMSALPDFLRDAQVRSESIRECLSADEHIVASQYSGRSVVAAGVDTRRVHVVPYGVDISDFGPMPDQERSGFLFVGALSRQKGVSEILAGSSVLGAATVMKLVGDSVAGEDELYAAAGDNVKFLGRMDKKQLAQEYARSSVFVFPSLCDGFGQVVLEALASGLPVICSRNSVGGDIIQDGVNGFLVQAGNAALLADRMRWCLDNPQEVEAMRVRARESVEGFTWHRYEQGLASVLRRLVPCA